MPVSAVARPGQSRRRTTVIAAVLLVTTLVVAVACSTSGSSSSPTTAAKGSSGRSPDAVVAAAKFSDLPAYSNVPWADALKAEQDRFDATEKGPSEYGNFHVPDFTGRFTNVVNNERATLQSKCDGCPKKMVWFVGASSAFGLGQRDDYTVASNLVRLGDQAGLNLTVRNMAIPGTTMVEAVKGIEQHLATDPQRPDVVVFYDGFNDVLASYIYAIVKNGKTMDRIMFEPAVMKEYLPQVPSPKLPQKYVAPVASHVASRINAVRGGAAAALSAKGIHTLFFQQPDAFVNPLQMKGIAQSLNVTMSELAKKPDVGQVLDQTAVQLDTRSHNLRPAMATLDTPVFADVGHVNETGALAMATEVWKTLGPQLAAK